MIRRKSVLQVTGDQGLMESHFKSLRIASRGQGTPRRGTDWSRGVSARELHVLTGKFIKHRSLIVRTTITTEIAVPEIIRQDEKDVRTL